MTANEIYQLPTTDTSHDLYHLAGCYYNHLPEAGGDSGEWVCLKTKRIEVRIVKDFDYDGRRFWKLATVWFDDEPVMIIQNAGREGDDHAARYVTNVAALGFMASHVRSLVQTTDKIDIINPAADMPELTNFYGQSLGGVFKRHSY